jgi:hypothetical protein
MVPTTPLTGLSPAQADPDLYPPLYTSMLGTAPATPAPIQREPQTLKIVTAVVLGAFVILCVVGSVLTNKRRNTPPPTPKISAQDRATGFVNELMALYTNPAFFNANTVGDIARPVAQKYIHPEGFEEFLEGMEEEMSSSPMYGQTADQVSLIKQIYVADPRYTVVSQTASDIVLDVAGGDTWIILRDGQSVSTPMRDSFRRFYLQNVDGVWYIKKIDFNQ